MTILRFISKSGETAINLAVKSIGAGEFTGLTRKKVHRLWRIKGPYRKESPQALANKRGLTGKKDHRFLAFKRTHKV